MTRGRVILWSGASLAGLAVLYALSGGPLVFAYARLGDFFGGRMQPVYLIVMRPHFALAYRYEGYFAYLSWFQRLDTPSPGYQKYRESYERTYRLAK